MKQCIFISFDEIESIFYKATGWNKYNYKNPTNFYVDIYLPENICQHEGGWMYYYGGDDFNKPAYDITKEKESLFDKCHPEIRDISLPKVISWLILTGHIEHGKPIIVAN